MHETGTSITSRSLFAPERSRRRCTQVIASEARLTKLISARGWRRSAQRSPSTYGSPIPPYLFISTRLLAASTNPTKVAITCDRCCRASGPALSHLAWKNSPVLGRLSRVGFWRSTWTEPQCGRSSGHRLAPRIRRDGPLRRSALGARPADSRPRDLPGRTRREESLAGRRSRIALRERLPEHAELRLSSQG
jgi:hypothetical protein